MNREEIIRGWKDEGYRSALSGAQLAELPPNPAGLIELSEEETELVGGMTETIVITPTIMSPLFIPWDTTTYTAYYNCF
jgi:mersacidin/lichenicidin family type 2 lantibiotic